MDTIKRIRKFNRFYSRVNGVNNEYTDSTKFSALEAQLLYEICYQVHVTAADLSKRFDIDKGYLSRVLKKLERRGLVKKEQFPGDKRVFILQITKDGQSELDQLIQLSNKIVEEKIKHLSPEELKRVIDAMTCIEQILGKYY
ncbi:MAG: MarR family transcriptional regulator [Sporolactobacillus sp.]|nr:MarR family transcriptional regulator [Sporolactobacillus sp.]